MRVLGKLDGPTIRYPEPDEPESADPAMYDPQDMSAEGRRWWVDNIGADTLRDTCIELMEEIDRLRGQARRVKGVMA